MRTLIELLQLNENYNSKSGRGIGTDKELNHNYITSFYEENFLPYRDKIIDLLEIGTGHGGSLLLWNDYFSNGTITGVDVNDYVDPVIDTYPRIKRFTTNAYTEEFVRTQPDFDIVIDDGPHTLQSFEACLRLYLPKVKKNGMLVIEDIPDINYIKYMEILAGGYKTEVIDTREKYGRFDNIMFIVFK